MKASFLLLPLFFPFSFSHAEPPPRSVSGIYPSLAMFNQEGECGTGAVVPWAGRLWIITYGPHRPFGSSDKLYEITPELTQIIRPESIGGTHAEDHPAPVSSTLPGYHGNGLYSGQGRVCQQRRKFSIRPDGSNHPQRRPRVMEGRRRMEPPPPPQRVR